MKNNGKKVALTGFLFLALFAKGTNVMAQTQSNPVTTKTVKIDKVKQFEAEASKVIDSIYVTRMTNIINPKNMTGDQKHRYYNSHAFRESMISCENVIYKDLIALSIRYGINKKSDVWERIINRFMDSKALFETEVLKMMVPEFYTEAKIR